MPKGRVNSGAPIPCHSCGHPFKSSVVGGMKRKARLTCPGCVKIEKARKRRKKGV